MSETIYISLRDKIIIEDRKKGATSTSLAKHFGVDKKEILKVLQKYKSLLPTDKQVKFKRK